MLRRARPILLAVVAGFTLAVAVAWACAWAHTPVDWNGASHSQRFGESRAASPFWFVSEQRLPGGTLVARVAQDDAVRYGTKRSPEVEVLPPSRIPRWSAAHVPPDAADTVYPERNVLEFAYGWPLRAMVYEVEGVRLWHEGMPYEVRAVRDAIPFPPRPGAGTPRDRMHALPGRPLWLGLTANAFLYAAFLLLPLAAVRVRAAARTRRGRCARCGYPLLEAARCPECGST